MRPRPDELLAWPCRFMPTCRLTRRLPVGSRRLDPHLERHPALSDERPEERVDGGGYGQAELVQDGRGLLLDLRVDADRRGRYVRRHGLTPPVYRGATILPPLCGGRGPVVHVGQLHVEHVAMRLLQTPRSEWTVLIRLMVPPERSLGS